MRVVAPTPDPDDQYFWDGVARGELLLQRCASCHELRQPPSPMCPKCSSLEWDTQRAVGRARVYSWIASGHPSDAASDARIVALLDLEEGVRMVSNLIDVALADVRHGLEVELTFAEYDGVRLPQFRPSDGAGS